MTGLEEDGFAKGRSNNNCSDRSSRLGEKITQAKNFEDLELRQDLNPTHLSSDKRVEILGQQNYLGRQMRMETTSRQISINRTLAVIDGGMNAKTSIEKTPVAQQPKLLDQVRQAIRTRHYSYRTEKAYVHWIKRFILFYPHSVD
jgi:integrase-like protein